MIVYIIWDLDPRIFEGVEFLRWYGVCWAVGMMVGYALMQRIYHKEGRITSEFDKLFSYLLVGIIVGARLGHILFYDPLYYLSHPLEILPFRLKPHFEFTGIAGLASHGGIVGALLALYFYRKKYQVESLWILDRVVIGGAFLGGFIRLGNLMNSEIIGTSTDLPWAFIFTRVHGLPRHPSQLYEAIFYFLIGFALYALWKSRRFIERKGFSFGLAITLIFTQRFLVEFVKENQVLFENGLPLNMGQILSIPLMVIGLAFMRRAWREPLRVNT